MLWQLHDGGTAIPSAAGPAHDDVVHGGYAVHQLFVDKKYGDLKEEMMGNLLCTLSPFQFAVSAQKASLLCSSRRVRGTKTGDIPSALRQYGIAKGSAMTKQHVLSVVLYCDWQRLSDALRSSLRATTPSESVNCELANWSKFLRETVELFGSGEGQSADGGLGRDLHRRHRKKQQAEQPQETPLPNESHATTAWFYLISSLGIGTE